MLAKDNEVFYLYDTPHILGVVLPDISEDFNLDVCLVSVLLFVLYDLQCQVLPLFMIEHFVHLAVRPFTQEFYQLVAIGYMIVELSFVFVSALIYVYSALSYSVSLSSSGSLFLSLCPI